MLTPDLTVAQVLEACPQAAHVFISLKTDCIGCYLMSFCTLDEVAGQYHLDIEDVMAALANLSEPRPKSASDTNSRIDYSPGDNAARQPPSLSQH